MNKGEMMKHVYSSYELRNIDAAIPKCYWDGLDPSIQVDTSTHVMNYNEPNRMGKLENMELVAKERNIDLDKPLSKSIILARAEGFKTAEEMTTSYLFSSIVPGICTNDCCQYTTNVEPDQNKGYCESCLTKSVKSILILEDKI